MRVLCVPCSSNKCINQRLHDASGGGSWVSYLRIRGELEGAESASSSDNCWLWYP